MTTKPVLVESSPAVVLDPFDDESLRLDSDFTASLGVKKLLTTIPVRRPDKQWFIRVHPDPAFRRETTLVELKEDNEFYIVPPHMRMELPEDLVSKLLITAINRQGSLFIWTIKLPDGQGKLDEWSRSAFEATKYAEKQWIRLTANRSLGAYETVVAVGALPEPDWKVATEGKSFNDLLRIAFKGRVIDSLEHQVVKQLRGVK